jgi:hypothetical protein
MIEGRITCSDVTEIEGMRGLKLNSGLPIIINIIII